MKQDTYYFPYERLEAYQAALRFYQTVLKLAGPHLHRGQTRYDQLVDASESILRNLAEGGSSLSPGMKSKAYQLSLGSAGECASCLTIIELRFPNLSELVKTARAHLELTARLTAGLVRRVERCR